MLRNIAFALLMLTVTSFAACDADDDFTASTITLQVHFRFGDEAFRTDGTMYVNEAGEPFTLSDFKFYLSNLVLEDAAGNRVAEPDSYHLVRLPEDNGAYQISIPNLGVTEYTTLHYSIGVDPTANLSIDQTGDLDPTNQMAWNWNTGYKFLLAEGFYVPAGGAQGLVYHVGGNDNLRSGSIALPAGTGLSEENTVDLDARIDRVFGGVHTISFAEANEVKGGDAASKVADNYGNDFLILSAGQ